MPARSPPSDDSPQARSAEGPGPWLVSLVILALAGSLAGLVAAYGDFRDPRPLWHTDGRLLLFSGWAHLGVLALLAMVLLTSSVLSPAATRRVQLAVLLSIVAHGGLAVFLYVHYLPTVDPWFDEVRRMAFEDSSVPLLPDYHWQRVDDPAVVEEFEKPVPTEAPNPVERGPDDPQKIEPEVPIEKLRPPQPEAVPPLAPEVVAMRRVELPAPRRDAELAGIRISRQEQRASLAPGGPIPEPEIRPAAPLAPRELQPERPAVERQSAAPRLASRSLMAPEPEVRPVARWALPERPAAEPLAQPSPVAALALPREPTRFQDLTGDVADSGPPLAPAEPRASIGSEEAGPEARTTAVSRRPDVLPGIGLAGEPSALGAPGVHLAAAGPRRRSTGGEIAWASAADPIPLARAASPPTLALGAVDEAMAGPPQAAGGGSSGFAPGPDNPEASSGTGSRADVTAPAGPDLGLAGPAVPLAAEPGPGGLSRTPGPALGTSSRYARPESQVAHALPGRLTFERSVGPLPIKGGVREPQAAFRQRSPRERRQRARAFGSTTQTEEAVERGVDFFARHQFPDGHWSLDRFPQGQAPGYEHYSPGEMSADTAATGLALLAFLGAGYTHRDGKHQDTVRRGVGWLVAHQNADGSLFRPRSDASKPAQFYGHAIGTIALCEALGMTGDAELRGPTQRAIRSIVESQNPDLGGWRYEPRLESDTSVSGWKLMALRSAQMAGLDVPAETLERASRWLDAAQEEQGAFYVYNPFAADTDTQRAGRMVSPAMTAEGLLMRMYLGWDRKHPALAKGVGYLLEHLPAEGAPNDPPEDRFYYWYYATQVMFQMQGDPWKQWNDRLRPLLQRTQLTVGPLAGSWDPKGAIRDRWAPFGGRHYVTALGVLMLEVYYRHLPLYKSLEK